MIQLTKNSPIGYFLGPDYCSAPLNRAAKDLRLHYNVEIHRLADVLSLSDDEVVGIEMGEYSFTSTADFEFYFAALQRLSSLED